MRHSRKSLKTCVTGEDERTVDEGQGQANETIASGQCVHSTNGSLPKEWAGFLA